MTTHTFFLYVAGGGDLARRAQANFDRQVRPALLRSGLSEQSVRCEVVDVTEEPERACEGNVLTTPMLVRTQPDPVVRLLGTLDDTERVLSLLVPDPDQAPGPDRPRP